MKCFEKVLINIFTGRNSISWRFTFIDSSVTHLCSYFCCFSSFRLCPISDRAQFLRRLLKAGSLPAIITGGQQFCILQLTRTSTHCASIGLGIFQVKVSKSLQKFQLQEKLNIKLSYIQRTFNFSFCLRCLFILHGVIDGSFLLPFQSLLCSALFTSSSCLSSRSF